jgi:uridine kinase
MPAKPIVVGVAGGSGSGKSTVVARIVEALGAAQVAVVAQDHYYRDRADLTPEARRRINYDHPDAIDEPLLVAHIRALAAGEAIDRPAYDFVQHLRMPLTVRLDPRPCVVVEGILVLAAAALLELLDVKIYVDTDADVRFIRRLLRDLEERGRTLPEVVAQYLESVRPMHLQFVEPSKRDADLILPEGGLNQVGIDVILARIRQAVVNG